MTQVVCRECGARLPDNARTCLQCGTAVEVSGRSIGGSPQNLDFVRPALAGGLLLGLLSSIPIINAANAVFGAWILVGGALSAHLLMKQGPSPGINYGDGAFVGVLSGFFGSIVATIMLIPSKIFFIADWVDIRQQFETQMNKRPEVVGPLRDLSLRAVSPEVSLTTELYWLFMLGIVFSLVAMFGAMLMVWMANRRQLQSKLK
jgi:hypothetical protein